MSEVTKDVTELTKPSRADMLADSIPPFDNERQAGKNEAVLPDVALPFPLPGQGQFPAGNVPTVHGTPQIGSFPIVHGTPPAPGYALPGQGPTQDPASEASHAAQQARPWEQHYQHHGELTHPDPVQHHSPAQHQQPISPPRELHGNDQYQPRHQPPRPAQHTQPTPSSPEQPQHREEQQHHAKSPHDHGPHIRWHRTGGAASKTGARLSSKWLILIFIAAVVLAGAASGIATAIVRTPARSAKITVTPSSPAPSPTIQQEQLSTPAPSPTSTPAPTPTSTPTPTPTSTPTPMPSPTPTLSSSPTVIVQQVWTSDSNNNAQSSFYPGDTIHYMVAAQNTNSAPATATVTYLATGPQQIYDWSGSASLASGPLRFYSSPTIPTDAPAGTYTITVTITYNSLSSQGQSQFTVVQPLPTPTPTPTLSSSPTVIVQQVWTADSNNNAQSSFYPGDTIHYMVAAQNMNSAPVTATVTYLVTGPQQIYDWSGSASLASGPLRFYSSPTIPTDAPAGTYTITVTITYNSLSSQGQSQFTVVTAR